jgi:hypothetical protein
MVGFLSPPNPKIPSTLAILRVGGQRIGPKHHTIQPEVLKIADIGLRAHLSGWSQPGAAIRFFGMTYDQDGRIREPHRCIFSSKTGGNRRHQHGRQQRQEKGKERRAIDLRK